MSRIFLLFIIIALLSSIEARHKSRHKNKHHHECKHKDRTNKIFKHFYEDVIEVDKKEENFCNGLDDVSLKEFYGIDHYKLIVPLKNTTEEELKVKVHHRALLVKVADKFSVMRNLPQIVNPKLSSYIIEDGNVLISFTYNIEIGKEVEVKCDNEIDDNSIYVSKNTEKVQEEEKQNENETLKVSLVNVN